MRRNLSMPGIGIFVAVFALTAIIGVVNAWNAEPHLWLTYQLQSPGAAPVKVQSCGDDDAREYFYRDVSDRRNFNIELCFKAVKKNQLTFIPYATDEDGASWIELKNSPQVGSHMRSVARSFTVPEADRRAALAQWQKEKWRARLESLAQLALTLCALGLLYPLITWAGRRYFGFASATHTGQGA